MNTERLNLVIKGVLEDFRTTSLETLIDQLVAHLSNQVSQPN